MQKSLTARAQELTSPGSTVLVNDEVGLLAALRDLSTNQEILAFDCEGVNLGRKGSLTIATISRLEREAHVYVVDVQVIGGVRAFSNEEPSLRSLLEDTEIKKVMFDCRTDSEALKHQFNVSLGGVLDLQVLDQAVRIQGGAAPPRRSPYLANAGIPFLQSMPAVMQRYSISEELKKLEKSAEAFIMPAWGTRPLSASALDYAANDVKIIKALHSKMAETTISAELAHAVEKHCKRNEAVFRDSESSVHASSEKIEEHPIISECDLPANHPRREEPLKGHTGLKWDEAVKMLTDPAFRGNSVKAFNSVLFILQHDEWYTTQANAKIRELSSRYPFTPKQRTRIASPPKLTSGDRYDDEYEYGSD